MREITWGKKTGANGGTYSFHELINDIYKRGDAAFVNLVLTDGEFNTINEQQVADTLNKMDGLFIMVTNNQEGTFDSLERKVSTVCGKNKLKVIYTPDFSVSK